MQYFFSLFARLLPGLQYTVTLFAITLIVSLPLGLLLCFGRVSKNPVLKSIIGFYVWLMRGTPLMLQLFFFYYGLPKIPVIGVFLTADRFTTACIAFALNYAAYFCEIFRGGLLSVDKGQYEAAKVLGFSKFQTSTRIVIPQMLRVSLPPVSNECITLVKDTALATAIGVSEILHLAEAAVNSDVDPLAFVAAAIFYLAMTYGLTVLFRWLEKKMSY